MEDFEGTPASHILLSQRPDPKEKQVINLDQDVQVCGYIFGGWWMKLLYMNSLSLVIFFWYGLYFLLFLFFSTRLVCMWHTFFRYASFISFF